MTKKITGNLLILIIYINLPACSWMYKKVGGDFEGKPQALQTHISKKANALIKDAFMGLPTNRLTDFHTHIIGLNTHNSGTFVNPAMQSIWHPIRNLRYKVYLNAAGISDESQADSLYLNRLSQLIKSIPAHGKYAIMAFDKHYKKNGTLDSSLTEFYTPNSYIFKLTAEYPDLFIPVISVHPYRKDAIRALEKWAAQGAHFVKWLPNAMGMNAADSSLIPFYKTMVKHNMVLISHTGEEKAVEAEEWQKLGNPLLFRLPLDLGVTVVMAHCASLGKSVDLDSEGQELVPNFELFLRLMDEPKYNKNLFGEISALTQYNRFDGPLQVLLEREDLQKRLINGSDYPLPAINIIVRTSNLQDKGFISEEEEEALNEIYSYNPLLFDFVVKRTIRHPDTGKKFSDTVFLSPFDF